MGSTLYSSSSRSLRATDAGYFSKSINDVFEQNKVNLIHLVNGYKNQLIAYELNR